MCVCVSVCVCLCVCVTGNSCVSPQPSDNSHICHQEAGSKYCHLYTWTPGLDRRLSSLCQRAGDMDYKCIKSLKLNQNTGMFPLSR